MLRTVSFIFLACNMEKISIIYFRGFVATICKYSKDKTCWVPYTAWNGAVKSLSGIFLRGKRDNMTMRNTIIMKKLIRCLKIQKSKVLIEHILMDINDVMPQTYILKDLQNSVRRFFQNWNLIKHLWVSPCFPENLSSIFLLHRQLTAKKTKYSKWVGKNSEFNLFFTPASAWTLCFSAPLFLSPCFRVQVPQLNINLRPWVEGSGGEEDILSSLRNASSFSLLLNTFFSSTVAWELSWLCSWIKQAFQWWTSKANKLWRIKRGGINVTESKAYFTF